MNDFVQRHKKDLLIYFGYILALVVLIILAVAFRAAPYNKLAINIGPIQIAWYAVFILFGIITATIMAYQEFKRIGWDPEILMDGLLIIAPLAILGARIYYVLFDPKGIATTFIDWIAIWDGGLAIHGAIIVATIGIIIFSKYKKINLWTLADILAIGFLMGQIAGRWGNFINAEAHGGITTNQTLINILPNFITNQMVYSSSAAKLTTGIYQPTFLYESLLNFVGLTILIILRRKRLLKNGETMGLYLIWYGLVRGLVIEPMRTDQLMIGNIPVNILLSIILLVGAGVAIIIYKRVFKKDDPYYFDLLIEKEEDVVVSA